MTSLSVTEPATVRTAADLSAGVLLDGVTKRYDDDSPALDVDRLHIPGQSLTVLVGPSGCGKSTALGVVSGLIPPTDGRVLIDGTDVTDVSPGRRGVSMVFQDFALYPHMTVERNISFGLRLQAKHDRRSGLDRVEIERRVAQACDSLGLSELRHRRPAQLSGGQRQRVGLARAIVRQPKVLLLDEPLSALDAQLRQQARVELVRLHRELGNTVVLVTHDQLEALSMATHLVVMNKAKVLQVGSPAEVYRRPLDLFVATFLGSPPMNLATVTLNETHDVLTGPGLTARLAEPVLDVPDELRLGWRPGDGTLESGSTTGPSGLSVHGVVDLVEFTGDTKIAQCTGPSGRWAVTVPANGPAPAVGESVRVHVPADRLHLFDPATGARVEAADAPADHQR
ncbi:ABC transporter ATP-binding protein [Nocardia mangyaensis]|uniref:ABC transporter ATP-binding protein n=1 Tax=Nocardia mangyaensis TaxID=2213200 RepID=UPI00267515CD|nr:ABC transporter ATP-binding protein [Nocardia mangyaensis]MDO3648387.1 ABC transporter ATP-binding protein [Nocardia mangyaensis]